MNKIFIPHELKTIEVDAEKKIFRINGEDFGDGCTGFMISCTPDDFRIDMEVDTKLCIDRKKDLQQYERRSRQIWHGSKQIRFHMLPLSQ